jgi:hypothetical protein
MLSVSFDIANTGIVPLWDVGASLGIGQIVMKGKLDRSFMPSFKSELVKPEWIHHTLDGDERFTVDLRDLFLVTAYSGAWR